MFSVNKFMTEILAKYSPVAEDSKPGDKLWFVQLVINNAQLNKFDGWDVDVLKITIFKISRAQIVLKPSDIAEMFDGKLTIRFSKNNSKRQIVKNKALIVNIKTNPETFNDITYYPSKTFAMSSKQDMSEVKTLITQWSELLRQREFGSVEALEDNE